MVGDTPDDVASAAAAGCSHRVGVLLPGDDARLVLEPDLKRDDIPLAAAMKRSGATVVIRAGLAELLDIVPPLSSSM